MNQQERSAWSEPYRNAVDEIVGASGSTTFYVTESAIELDRCADLEAWKPTGFITEAVPNVDDIEVELITKDTCLKELNKKLIEEKNIGLIVMGPIINRTSKPLLIVITTKDKLYAIDPDDRLRGIEFLKRKLEDKNIKFWTTNGINEADSLWANYGMKLVGSNASCCTGYHIRLLQSIASMTAPLKGTFPLIPGRIKQRIGFEKFESLVEIWLDIDKEDFKFSSSQLIHLKTRPLSLTAINVIKKRCVLVLPLAQALESYNWLEVRYASRVEFNMLLSRNEKVTKLLKKIIDNQENEEPSVGNLTYLDAGIGSFGSRSSSS